MLAECRAYYSQEYRLNMLRQALRKAMSDMDMGVTQYWALIDADGIIVKYYDPAAGTADFARLVLADVQSGITAPKKPNNMPNNDEL